MTSTAQRRLRAGLIDLGLMLVWALAVGLVTLALLTGGALAGVGPLGLNLAGIAAVVLPVTIGLTVLEAGRYEATPGKLKLGLRVRHDPGGERISWGRSFLRNLLKLGLPWLLLHLAVITATVGGGGVAAWFGFLLAVAVPVAYVATLYRGDGRTIYDHLAGTMVISTEPGRRFAADEADEAVEQPVDEPRPDEPLADEPAGGHPSEAGPIGPEPIEPEPIEPEPIEDEPVEHEEVADRPPPDGHPADELPEDELPDDESLVDDLLGEQFPEAEPQEDRSGH